MKKILSICLLMAATFIVNAQKTFSSKKEAIEFLKETLAANFVKTAVVGKYDGKIFNKYNYYFDYELTDEYLKIYKKTESGDVDDYYQNYRWELFKFEDIRGVTLIEKSTYYKNVIGVGFTSRYQGDFQSGVGRTPGNSRTENSQSYGQFPFNNANNIEVMGSLRNAIKAIVKENENVATEKKRIDAEIALKRQKLLLKENPAGEIFLPNFKVFTEAGLQEVLPDYIQNNKRFKDKPTLVMTWAYNWCNPCIKKIDEILKADLAKKYNVILVNRNSETEISFSDIRVRLATKSPKYTKDAIVLFDRNGQFAPLDNNSAPVFIWLDKNLKIVYVQPGYGFTVELIEEKLLEVEQNTKN